jgi:hypothetical protein
MSTSRDAMVQWIDQRIERILAAPPMWGSPEAVEMQVLQLLQMRAVALRAPHEPDSSKRVVDAYLSYLSLKFPKQPQQPLFEHVRSHDDANYAALSAGLRGFVEALVPTMR